jgi:tetratricopeptide (TPR) repeat protein
MNKPELDLSAYVQRALMAPSSTAFTTIAQIYQLKGEWTLAHSWYQRAINLEPNNSENWFYLGNYYQSLAQWEKALDNYDQALKYDPTSPDIVLAIGAVQEKLGYVEDAQGSYQRAIEMDPGSINGYIALAEFQLNQEDSEKALGTIQEGIIQVPGDYRGYETLADIYNTIDPDNIEQAEEAYRTGLNILPGVSALYISIGELHTEHVFTAWQNLTAAEKLDRLTKNRYEAVLIHFGVEDEDLSQQSRFVQDTVTEAKLNYDRNHRYLLAAQEKYEQNYVDFDIATNSYTNALSLDPNNELALLGLGRLQLAHGLEEKAVSYFEQACAMNPYSSLSLSYLGNIYLDLGRTDEAVYAFEQIRALDPGNSFAQAAIVDAYHNQKSLTISQAVASVEQGVFKLESLVDYLRKTEILELK